MRREHLVDGWWELPGEPVPELGWGGTKNGSSHRIWLPDPVRAMIGNTGSGLVFTLATVPMLATAMRTICARLGAERATPHDLRRTHGTTVTSLGFGRELMNRIQNHREGGIASVYDRHRYSSEIKHAMEATAQRIMALAEGRAGDNVVAMKPRR